MRNKFIPAGIIVFLFGISTAISANAQTDVAASLYGAFSGGTTGEGVQQSPSNAAGGLLKVRHIRNPLIGYEATYSFNRANQTYSGGIACGFSCLPLNTGSVSANAHEVTGDWVVSLHLGNLRPFALAGGGVLIDVPVNGATHLADSTSTEGVFVYGGGLDWGLVPHLGLRLQYRGNVYKAPQLIDSFSSTNAFTHTAEPMVGVYFRL